MRIVYYVSPEPKHIDLYSFVLHSKLLISKFRSFTCQFLPPTTHSLSHRQHTHIPTATCVNCTCHWWSEFCSLCLMWALPGCWSQYQHKESLPVGGRFWPLRINRCLKGEQHFHSQPYITLEYTSWSVLQGHCVIVESTLLNGINGSG